MRFLWGIWFLAGLLCFVQLGQAQHVQEMVEIDETYLCTHCSDEERNIQHIKNKEKAFDYLFMFDKKDPKYRDLETYGNFWTPDDQRWHDQGAESTIALGLLILADVTLNHLLFTKLKDFVFITATDRLILNNQEAMIKYARHFLAPPENMIDIGSTTIHRYEPFIKSKGLNKVLGSIEYKLLSDETIEITVDGVKHAVSQKNFAFMIQEMTFIKKSQHADYLKVLKKVGPTRFFSEFDKEVRVFIDEAALDNIRWMREKAFDSNSHINVNPHVKGKTRLARGRWVLYPAAALGLIYMFSNDHEDQANLSLFAEEISIEELVHMAKQDVEQLETFFDENPVITAYFAMTLDQMSQANKQYQDLLDSFTK